MFRSGFPVATPRRRAGYLRDLMGSAGASLSMRSPSKPNAGHGVEAARVPRPRSIARPEVDQIEQRRRTAGGTAAAGPIDIDDDGLDIALCTGPTRGEVVRWGRGARARPRVAERSMGSGSSARCSTIGSRPTRSGSTSGRSSRRQSSGRRTWSMKGSGRSARSGGSHRPEGSEPLLERLVRHRPHRVERCTSPAPRAHPASAASRRAE